MELRPLLHDLGAPSIGYSSNLDFEIFDAKLRYERDAGRLLLDRLDLLKLIGLNLWPYSQSRYSWTLNIGIWRLSQEASYLLAQNWELRLSVARDNKELVHQLAMRKYF